MWDDEFEFDLEWDELEEATAAGLPFSESEEMELAAELLEVMDEAELEQFLGKLFKKVTRSAGRFLRSKAGRALGGVLKKVAKKALPIAGGALGTFIGGPAGTALGTSLGSYASRLFEMELEGLEPEEQEFEVARRFVRLAGTAAQKAATAPAGASPQTVAKAAFKTAAKVHAPGLLTTRVSGGRRNSGRWIRRGNRIVILGA